MGLADRLKQLILPDQSNVPRPDGGATGGQPARALIVDTRGAPGGDKGTTRWTRKQLELQLGDERTWLETWLSHDEFLAATVGSELPVRVDPASGAILGLDVAALESATRPPAAPRAPS